MPERIIYPLYPHLKGKQILIVDSIRGKFIDELETNLISQQEMIVSVLDINTFVNPAYSLPEIMDSGKFDIAVFHVGGVIDERNVLLAKQAGHNLVVLERAIDETKKDKYGLADSYRRIRDAGISTCIKLGDEKTMTLEVVNLVAEVLT